MTSVFVCIECLEFVSMSSPLSTWFVGSAVLRLIILLGSKSTSRYHMLLLGRLWFYMPLLSMSLRVFLIEATSLGSNMTYLKKGEPFLYISGGLCNCVYIISEVQWYFRSLNGKTICQFCLCFSKYIF